MNLRSLIDQGEHQQLDFKYCISDSRKIARTLSAFANSDGGRLLVGVRDNGSLAGVSSDEEYYMIEAAAELYCKPRVDYSMKTHLAEGKTILEVIVGKGTSRPYLARDPDGRWLAYARSGDQNILVNRVILEVWRMVDNQKSARFRFMAAEAALFEHLRENESITLSMFRKITGVPARKAERILAGFISVGILEYRLSSKGCIYLPSSNFETIDPANQANLNLS